MHCRNGSRTLQDAKQWTGEQGYIYMVPEQSPLVILNGNTYVCMANNGKDTKHTIHISIIIQFVKKW